MCISWPVAAILIIFNFGIYISLIYVQVVSFQMWHLTWLSWHVPLWFSFCLCSFTSLITAHSTSPPNRLWCTHVLCCCLRSVPVFVCFWLPVLIKCVLLKACMHTLFPYIYLFIDILYISITLSAFTLTNYYLYYSHSHYENAASFCALGQNPTTGLLGKPAL